MRVLFLFTLPLAETIERAYALRKLYRLVLFL
jgi:hypothetical protein